MEALGRYKYLSRSQFAKLGIEKYNSNYTKYCGPLLERKMIGVLNAKPYGLGLIYYLTTKGAKILSENQSHELVKLNYIRSTPTLKPQTLLHRKYAIDCQIELHLTCFQEGIEIDFYDRDIESLGSLKKDGMLQRKTRVPINKGQYLEPDAIFRLKTPKGDKLYCFELENATYTKKSYEKIIKHIRALNMKSPSKKYKHKKAHRVLMVYCDESIMKAVMKKMKQELSKVNNWFLFKTYEQAVNHVKLQKSTFILEHSKEYFHNWKTIQGNLISLY